MREQTCCFTGHRRISFGERVEITNKLRTVIGDLYQRGIRYYGAGGAIGFDALASKAVLAMKEECPGIKLILVLPCLAQTKGWNRRDIEEYEACAEQICHALLKVADRIEKETEHA